MGQETKTISALESGLAKLLAKHQPCGCVVCTCEDDLRCHGCGAKHCGTHPVGQIPNAVYEQQPAQPESGEVLAQLRKLEKAVESGKHYGFRQDIWTVAADEIDRLQSALTAAQQRIAALESKNADLRARLNHSERLQGRYPRDAT